MFFASICRKQWRQHELSWEAEEAEAAGGADSRNQTPLTCKEGRATARNSELCPFPLQAMQFSVDEEATLLKAPFSESQRPSSCHTDVRTEAYAGNFQTLLLCQRSSVPALMSPDWTLPPTPATPLPDPCTKNIQASLRLCSFCCFSHPALA